MVGNYTQYRLADEHYILNGYLERAGETFDVIGPRHHKA